MRSRSWAPAAANVGLWAVLAARPGIGPALGMGRGAVDSLAVLRSLAAGAGALGVAWAVLRVGRFRSVAPVSAVATVLSGFATDAVGLLGLQVAAGAMSPPAAPDSRASRAVAMAGAPVGIALAAFVTLGLGLTWRVVLWVAGGLAVVAVVAAGRSGEADVAPSSDLRFGEQVRRLLLLRTTAPVLGGYVVSGMASLPLVVYLSSHLQQRWDFGPAAVAAVAVVALAASAAAVAAGRRPVPAEVALWAGALALVMTAAAPIAAVAVVGAILAFAAFGAGVGALDATVRRVVPAELRPVATALQAAAASLVGVAVGYAQFAGIERRFGNGGALVSLAFTAWLVGGGLRKAAAFVDDDVQRVADEAAERVRVAALRARGERPPMLACRGVDFSYGQMQVLFGVDFSVEDGELVALLGTNGAGKSTLLRVVSGLGLPSAGTVHLDGTDITHWGAERRVVAGITQISGGRAVFGPLSVAENLRLFGYREGRSGRAVDEGIDATFDHFPVLAERRNQAAQTLSGGEQQMLALGKALILKPRLLLVDELSLGLAPVVVAALIPMVREINRRGTSVVVVEQSVNVALTLAEHAYFMEKGEIRFDGKAKDLLDRPDILRSVFLEGAVKRGLAG